MSVYDNFAQPKPTVNRGDVALVLFPNSNLSSAKTRPALIVQADALQTGLPQIIVAIITSQMFRAGHPSRVTILLNSLEGQQSGLLADSVVMPGKFISGGCNLSPRNSVRPHTCRRERSNSKFIRS